jgi:3'-phosphoadenosine 5'-phosphosulfate sulfotransferase (PAPS reductase)/FAD synthetase
MEQLKVFSFGGGVQSTACMVLAAQGKIDYKVFLFADTGDEHPETYDYLENVHKPFAEKHGLELHCLKRTWRDGSQYSIRENIDRLKSAIPIPVYLESGMPRQRHCTADWKINVVYKCSMGLLRILLLCVVWVFQRMRFNGCVQALKIFKLTIIL